MVDKPVLVLILVVQFQCTGFAPVTESWPAGLLPLYIGG
jgi:hypothetical protein